VAGAVATSLAACSGAGSNTAPTASAPSPRPPSGTGETQRALDCAQSATNVLEPLSSGEIRLSQLPSAMGPGNEDLLPIIRTAYDRWRQERPTAGATKAFEDASAYILLSCERRYPAASG
jgi:hypothetical protein